MKKVIKDIIDKIIIEGVDNAYYDMNENEWSECDILEAQKIILKALKNII